MAAGVRGPLAFWLGGASAAPTVTQAGVHSLLAFWAGGARAGAATPPDIVFSGGGYRIPVRPRRRQIDDEELFILVAAALHVIDPI